MKIRQFFRELQLITSGMFFEIQCMLAHATLEHRVNSAINNGWP